MNDDYSVSVRGDAAVVTGSARFRPELTKGTRSGRVPLDLPPVPHRSRLEGLAPTTAPKPSLGRARSSARGCVTVGRSGAGTQWSSAAHPDGVPRHGRRRSDSGGPGRHRSSTTAGAVGARPSGIVCVPATPIRPRSVTVSGTASARCCPDREGAEDVGNL